MKGSIRMKGSKGSTDFCKGVLGAAVGTVSQEAADAITAEPKWRVASSPCCSNTTYIGNRGERYAAHFYKMVEVSASSQDAALAVATSGLAEAASRLEFVLQSGETHTVLGAIDAVDGTTLHTAAVVGTGPQLQEPVIDYHGKKLTGKLLRAQLDLWVKRGTIEPSAATALVKVLDTKEWQDLSGRLFVVMGAGAAMGPTEVLLSLGATVVALDIPVKAVWERLIAMAQRSPGALLFPTNIPAQDLLPTELAAAAGCDLLNGGHCDAAKWLLTVRPELPMSIGAYAYLDGAKFIIIVSAMDAVMEYVRRRRVGVSYAYLCTPTDIHIRPKDAWADSTERWASRTIMQSASAAVSGGRFCQSPEVGPPISGGATAGLLYPVDCTVDQQGPNYLLAKRLQHWRAIIARHEGTVVSSNIAPASSTVSVTKAKLLAAAYAGTKYFPPIEIFPPQTSNAVMTYALIHDLRNLEAASQPTTRLANPLLLFTDGAWHGGFWRVGFKLSSVVEIAAILQLWDENKVKTRLATGVFLALVARVAGRNMKSHL